MSATIRFPDSGSEVFYRRPTLLLQCALSPFIVEGCFQKGLGTSVKGIEKNGVHNYRDPLSGHQSSKAHNSADG